MTMSVAGQGAESRTAAVASPQPILLALNASGRHDLTPFNWLLDALYGTSPLRVDVQLGHEVAYRHIAHTRYGALMRLNPTLSLEAVMRHIEEPTWLAEQARKQIVSQLLKQAAPTHDDRYMEAVQCVLIDSRLVGKDSVMRDALQPALPDATFIVVDAHSNRYERIWNEPPLPSPLKWDPMFINP